MTERTPPTWLQSGSYPAEDDRRFLATIFGDLEGIIKAGDLAVSQRGAGANMSVDVAGGRAIINGDLSTYEGSYFVENRGVTNLAISASDPTNPRIDRVVAEVLNAEYTGASNLWRLRVITGTPAGSPVAPAVPSNAISLATVAVAALASSITNANITSSVPTRATALGGTIICTSTTRPASAVQGTRIYETDTKLEYTYDGASWIIPYALGRLGYSSLVANSASFIAIIYPLSVSVTPLPNRRLRIECHANVYSTTTGANCWATMPASPSSIGIRTRPTPPNCRPSVAARTSVVRSASNRYTEQTSVESRTLIQCTRFCRVSPGLRLSATSWRTTAVQAR